MPNDIEALKARLDGLRLAAFKSGSAADLNAYYSALSGAFQNGELVPATALDQQSADNDRLRAENERLTAELDEAVKNAEVVCNSYADENQRLHDRAQAAEARAEKAGETLRAIGEGNLGDGPGQANYARIKQVALASLPKESADAD